MKADTGVIAGVSVAHDRATVDQLEAAAVESQRSAVAALRDAHDIDEAFVLQTCNRVEAYVVVPNDAAGHDALSRFTDPVDDAVAVEMGHEESLRHLLRVAAGLESLVLGEDQILGQVRDAYADARSVGGIGPTLEEGITKAIHVGERARTETAINEGAVSLASAAVTLATDECDLAGATALVVGAGEMGTLAAESLAEHVDRVVVANRTVPHAEHVARSVPVDASAVGLDAAHAVLPEARVVVSATGSPGYVLDAAAFADAGETFVVDIAQPRDVPSAAGRYASVRVKDLDALESVTDRTRQQRQAAAERVEAMIDEEFERLLTQYKRKRADRVISAMYESAERVKAEELSNAFDAGDFDDDQREVVEAMADAIVSQLLAAPTKSLRDAAEDDDWSTIHTALQLFDPDFGPRGDGPPAFVQDASLEDVPEAVREEIPAAVLEDLADD